MLILCVTIFLPTTVSTGLQGMPCQLESQVHSTNTLIDEVGLVEMEVGLDQLTWGDADLQRELRRLKDNSLKIPNLKYIFKIALLRVIPTLTHYSDIVSDISSGRICGIYVLTYYLTFFSEILFDILSGILSGIYSDILSGIYYILILPCHEFGLGVLLFAWINANGLNIHQMLVSHVCTQWLPLPLIPQNGQVLNLRVGPEKFSGYWKNRTLAQGLKKDVGGRFRYAVGLQSWVNILYVCVCLPLIFNPLLTSRRGTSSWFLKISDVDYGCGVRSFRCPVQREELRQLLELSRLEAQQALGQLRRAKGGATGGLGVRA